MLSGLSAEGGEREMKNDQANKVEIDTGTSR